MNFRLAPGSSPPPGARRLFADIYHLSLLPGADGVEQATLDAVSLWVEPDYPASVPEPQTGTVEGAIFATVDDPHAPDQYSLSRMAVPQAWDTSRGDGIVIAIVDTGLDFEHPDLGGKAVSRGRDFINGDNDAADDHGHGTHVAGIAAAVTNNGIGMAGVGYNARLLPVKVLAANGSGNHAAIAEGIVWAADQGAHIINLSLGSPWASNTLQAAVEYASRTALLTCAAGNDGLSRPSYPAAYPGCIAVAATDASDRVAAYSNFGSAWVDVAAPGSGVLGPLKGGGYVAWNGTSMAAPNVAGVAALVMAARRDWTREVVRSALELRSDRVLPGGVAAYGRVNAAAAVGSAPAPVPSPQPGATTTPQPSGDYAREIVDLINATRQQQGLALLRYDARLQNAADFHNRWMRDHNCFNHQCPGEPDVTQRMRNAGYPVVSAGENIGKGYQTPQHMLDGWMNSPGHRAAILNTVWPDIGCGYLGVRVGVDTATHWTCVFARGEGTQPAPQPTSAPIATSTPRPIVYPTARPPSPPADRAFLIEVRGSWREWDAAWFSHCSPPRPEYRCIFPPRSWLPWLSAKDAEINGGD